MGVLEEIEEEAAYRATMRERKSFAVSLWTEGIRDIGRIARLTKLTAEEVKEAVGVRLA
ncbi:MAG: hypothetical protein LUF92_01585 [Clostridiales bacterium]|nr:hypothetical protein [Clostridiales bacterium]